MITFRFQPSDRNETGRYLYPCQYVAALTPPGLL
jgi:hypothetical protein